MKTAIIYYSKHHENTKQLLDAIKEASSDEINLIDVTTTTSIDLSNYDMIGFASGIYYSKFEKRVLAFAKEHLPNNKDVFFIYTYGAKKNGYTNSIKEAIANKNASILGEYSCFGFNTFGPFKLIGGIAKIIQTLMTSKMPSLSTTVYRNKFKGVSRRYALFVTSPNSNCLNKL